LLNLWPKNSKILQWYKISHQRKGWSVSISLVTMLLCGKHICSRKPKNYHVITCTIKE
jgi:hypothetical protein